MKLHLWFRDYNEYEAERLESEKESLEETISELENRVEELEEEAAQSCQCGCEECC